MDTVSVSVILLYVTYLNSITHACTILFFFPIFCSVTDFYYEFYNIDHYITWAFRTWKYRFSVFKSIKKFENHTPGVLIFESVPPLFRTDCRPCKIKSIFTLTNRKNDSEAKSVPFLFYLTCATFPLISNLNTTRILAHVK